MRIYICDVDGTIADLSHRIHHIKQKPKNWDEFFAWMAYDTPIVHIREMLSGLKLPIMYVSGRPEKYKTLTAEWIKQNKFPWFSYLPFHMRPDGDRRDDTIIKSELLQKILADGYTPVMAFDDRTRVVEMWRSHGIPCAQVANGDF